MYSQFPPRHSAVIPIAVKRINFAASRKEAVNKSPLLLPAMSCQVHTSSQHIIINCTLNYSVQLTKMGMHGEAEGNGCPSPSSPTLLHSASFHLFIVKWDRGELFLCVCIIAVDFFFFHMRTHLACLFTSVLILSEMIMWSRGHIPGALRSNGRCDYARLCLPGGFTFSTEALSGQHTHKEYISVRVCVCVCAFGFCEVRLLLTHFLYCCWKLLQPHSEMKPL